jgi:hypothetical protein
MEFFMKRIGFFALLALMFAVSNSAVSAQETEERVVDEVVAQVNDGVITLSRVKREIKGIVDAEVQQGKKREDVEKVVEEKRGELIANLINEELLMQKAKDSGLDSEVDASVNRRFLEIMKQYNLKTLEALYKQMEENGVDPTEIRELWRKQAVRDIVLQKEVQSQLYWKPSGKDLKDYFEKNKTKFTKPETVSVSEIFLSFAGRNENTVREKAKGLVVQLRAGGDFAKLAQENSDPGVVTQGKGSIEKLHVSELSDQLTNAIKNVKVGAVTDPIEADQVGVVILRIDAHDQASGESYFDENAVRMALMQENYPAEQKKFFSTLRADSFIKLSENYRPLVSPILFEEERKEKAKPENK